MKSIVANTRSYGVRQGVSPSPLLLLLIVLLIPWTHSQSLPGNPQIGLIDPKNEGETVTLTCTSSGGNPLPSVQWYKNNQLVDPGSSLDGKGDGVYTVGATTVTYNNYTFQVSRSDNAVSYICKVNSSSLGGNALSRSLSIEVYVQALDPVISGPIPAAPTALDAYKSYNHTCTSNNGYRAANISWKLGTSLANSIDMTPSVSGRAFRLSESTVTNLDSTFTKISTLSWIPITDDHGKNLFCVTAQTTAPGATARTITKSTSVSIFVHQIPVVQILNNSYSVEVGQTVTLGCRIVTALPSPTNIYWSRFINGAYDRVPIDNVRFFGSSVSNPNLTITNVALSDATSYQCSATNTAGTGNSAMATLTVTGSEYSKVFFPA